jgi:hypothetical protein
MRFDLAFMLCCCKSFLGADDEESFYTLLNLDRDASVDDIKRAYKRQSLQMHPDKLAQRGHTVTAADQLRFTRMKEAYEILSDPYKREAYDAIGERGIKWLEEPFSVDPQTLAHNFANSSVVDRSKIFAIFVVIAGAVLILPLLVCLHVDGVFGPNASWLATLTPLWLWNVFILFYHTRVILMGPIQRPDHIPPEDWVDPLPMKKRIRSMLRFSLIVVFELLVALKLDDTLAISWIAIFIPLYIWEGITLYKKWPLARMRIVTVEDLEAVLGKPFSEFTPGEKELIGKRYSVVQSTESPDFDAAQKLKSRATHDIIKIVFRVVFVLVLLFQLEGSRDWSWWLVFLPFWLMAIVLCCAHYQAFAEVQKMAMDKDPELFGGNKEEAPDTTSNMEAGYGAVGTDGAATTRAASENTKRQLSEEERDELKAQVMASSSRMCSKCCLQGFLVFIVILVVAKLQGAGFSAVWIISPFLFVVGIILCCLGCAIFGISEIPTDGVQFEEGDFGESGNADPTVATTFASQSKTYMHPEAAEDASAGLTYPEVDRSATSIPPVTSPLPTIESVPVPVELGEPALKVNPSPEVGFHDLD